MNVFLQTDLEGVAGVTTFTQDTYPDARYYDEARRRLTAEVNAAVEGLVEMGVTDILVNDGHGPGAIWFDHLHPEAKLLHGRPVAHHSVREQVMAEYDVGMIIGQHAMAGVADGNLNHTQSSREIDSFVLNGEPIGEIAQFALTIGAMGKPLIYLTGDDAACEEAKAQVPGIATASVKRGLSRNSAISLSATKARQVIYEGVKRAVEQHRQTPVKPLVWEGPFTLDIRYFHSDTADHFQRFYDAERVNSVTIRKTSEDVISVLR